MRKMRTLWAASLLIPCCCAAATAAAAGPDSAAQAVLVLSSYHQGYGWSDDEQYKAIFWGSASVLIVLSAMVCVLVALLVRKNRAQALLKESRNDFAAVLNAVEEAMFLIDRDGIILSLNAETARRLKAPQRELVGRCLFDYLPEASAAHRRRHVAEAFRTGRTVRFEGERDGRTLQQLLLPIADPEGRTTRLAVYSVDVTEQKRAMSEVRASRDFLGQIIDTMADPIFVKDPKHRFVLVNNALCALVGQSREALLGKTDCDFFPREQVDIFWSKDDEVLASGHEDQNEEFVTTAEGRVATVITRKSCYIDPAGNRFVVGTIHDITERRRAEQEIRDSEERSRRLIEASTDGIIIQSEGTITYANPSALRLFRAERESDLIGRRYLELVHPDDRAESAERARRNAEEKWTSPAREHRILALDGQAVDVESTGVPVTHRGERQVFGVFRDITERKLAEAEKVKLERQLRQVQKMEAIGTLAGGIAHDFNNILSVIIGNSELLAMRDDLSPASRDGVDQVLAASQRAKQLVRQILTFSRQGEQQKLLVELKPVVKETVGFLRSSLPATIALEHFVRPDAGTVLADPTQMQQILMNLCTNAAHAMEEHGGTLRIELDGVVITDDDCRLSPGLEPGRYVKLSVSDTGHGMDLQVQERIFDPYFTTKGPSKGTGLGLSVVHGIVKAHGGMVRLYSEAGKGSVFHVFLPRADGDEKTATDAAQPPPKGSGTVLFVDDETGVAELGKRMLGFLGYRAETRTSPVEALELFSANPGRFDAVVTDMTMPQMTGLVLARKLTAIVPGVPIVLCTGFSETLGEERARALGISAVLLKPVLLNDMAHVLKRALGKKSRWADDAVAASVAAGQPGSGVAPPASEAYPAGTARFSESAGRSLSQCLAEAPAPERSRRHGRTV